MNDLSPSRPEELLVFGHAAEGLFVKALGSRLTPRARERLKSAGLNLDHFRPAYTLKEYDAFTEIAVEEVFPGISKSEAFVRLGELQVRGYLQTFMGRAVFQVLKLLSVRRFLGRLTHAWRSGTNFTEAKATEVGKNRYEVWVNEAGGHPEVSQGILAEAFRTIGHAGVRVTIKERNGSACTYAIEIPETHSQG